MEESLSMLVISIYVRKEDFSSLNNLDLQNIQMTLEHFMIDDGQSEVEVSLRIQPVIALKNTVQVIFYSSNEKLNYLEDTDAPEQLRNYLKSIIPIKISSFFFKQETSEDYIFSKEN